MLKIGAFYTAWTGQLRILQTGRLPLASNWVDLILAECSYIRIVMYIHKSMPDFNMAVHYQSTKYAFPTNVLPIRYREFVCPGF